ncbi:unnamed protein product, partial [Meganyctiphanes norvegica]
GTSWGMYVPKLSSSYTSNYNFHHLPQQHRQEVDQRNHLPASTNNMTSSQGSTIPYPSGFHDTLTECDDSPSKKYRCPFCPMAMKKRFNMLSHIRTHTGEKPYHCPVCSYKAAQKSSLDKHIRFRHPQWSAAEDDRGCNYTGKLG